ncbi:SH3 domain-containing protein [Christensenellaceae bacterium OttesenSCG-928-M15]|nr:SH3 domain-containing protein [Christensenellaceae bacterium OttesenSCG-928-M15]
MKNRYGVKFLAVLLTVLTVFCVCMSAAAAVEENVGKAKTVASAKLKAGEGNEYETLATIKKGATVTVLDQTSNPEWVRVIASNKEGFVERKNLDLPAVETATEETAAVTEQEGYANKTTKMREDNKVNGRVLYTLKKNTPVAILNMEGTRWQISYNGKTGYVLKGDLSLGAAPAGSQAASTTNKTATTADVNASKIAQAKKTNSDVVGWANVPNTNIDEPILYGANFYYANRNINKKKSSDSVYPYSNKKTKNIVVFGHNLRTSGTCFHQLHHLEEAARGYSNCQYKSCKKSISSLAGWYKTQAGRTFNVSIFGLQKWEVFAMYEVPAKESISTLRNNWALNPSNMDTWIAGQIKKSKSYMGFDFGVSVSGKDQIMTLITCGTNYDYATANSRLFIFLKNVD